LRIVVLEEIPEDSQLQQAWNELALRMERPEVFYTHEWAVAVQRAYSAALHPLLFLAYDDVESLCGVAALAQESKNGPVAFLCATTGDYCDFLSAPEQRSEFVVAVLGELRKRGVKSMAFANLPADSATAKTIHHAAHRLACMCLARPAYVCAQVSLERLERRANGKLVAPGKKRLRRFAKAMAHEGAVRVDHMRAWSDVATILPRFTQAHIARFLDTGRVSNLAKARRRIFLAELAKLLSERQWMVLSRMSVGEREVAWHYGFQFQGSWFWYQPTFDSSVEKYSPGFCLLTQVIQDATENPALTRLDLGLGSEAYKAKFANESRDTLYVTLHSSLLAHWGAVLRYRAASRIKASPATERMVGSLRAAISKFRRRLLGQGAKKTLLWAGRQLFRALWARDEVFFCEWENCQAAPASTENLQLHRLDLNRLADAAMEYEKDEGTLSYILRCAQRLRAEGEGKEGFVLTRENGRPVHFAWVAPLNGFRSAEWDAGLHAGLDSVIMFDCWTPPPVRGQGFYKRAIQLIAGGVKAEGKRPWIYGPATNPAWLRAIEKSGFKYRFSFSRKRIFSFRLTKASIPSIDAENLAGSAPEL
jgi:CelD/BcsL family acetyltransferase involved in cellulose biosynthesis